MVVFLALAVMASSGVVVEPVANLYYSVTAK